MKTTPFIDDYAPRDYIRSDTSMYQLSPAHSHTLARGLGWMSIGLGTVELLTNRKLSDKLGSGGEGRIFQLYGLREIGTGIGILASRNPMPWVWARVAGDLLDLATLAPELRSENPQRKVAAAATAFVAGATLIDFFCAMQETRQTRTARQSQLPAEYQPEMLEPEFIG